MADPFDKEFTIGTCRINRLQGTIANADGTRRVTPKAMEVLICLVRDAGELVRRDDIEQQVWGSGPVSNDALTHCISELRHTLDDHPENPDYIQTIPKRGYRLVASVENTGAPLPTLEPSIDRGRERSVSLWQELQRRMVIRTALAYGAIGWLLIQFTDTVFARISQEATSVIIALIILGFPIALVLAWMIERTKSGAKFERDWIENRRAKLLRQRNANILMVTISAVAIVAAGYILLQSRIGFTFERRDWVLVTHVENLTDDPVLDESLDRAFRMRLGQSDYVNMLPESVVRDALRRMQLDVSTYIDRDLGTEIAIRENARAVILASVAEFGNRYNLTAEIINPDRKTTVATRSVAADSRDRLLDAMQELVDVLRVDLGEALAGDPDKRDKPLERVTTRSLEALNAYSIAVQQNLDGNYQAAIDLLYRAVALDDEFATAYSMLGVLLMNIGRPRGEFEAYWAKALALEDRLTERERLHIIATNSWLEEPAKTERAWTLVTNVFPDDATAHHNLGIIFLQLLNQGQMALESFERAASLPNAHRDLTLIYLGFAQLFVGRDTDAVASFEKAWEINENPWNFALADGYVATTQYAKAKKFLDDNRESLSPVVNLMRQSRVVLYHLDRGELTLALSSLDEAVDFLKAQHKRPPVELQMVRLGILEVAGNAELFQEQLHAGLGIIDEVMSTTSPPVSSHFFFIPILRTAAIAARNGHVDAARSIYDTALIRDELPGYPVRTALHLVLGAEIALAQNDFESALELLHASMESVESFEAHSLLARVNEATGDIDAAKHHYQWIRDNRGRAFAEWHEDLVGRELNILDWSITAYRLGRIYDEAGEEVAAEGYYLQFANHWRDADSDIPALVAAHERRAAF